MEIEKYNSVLKTRHIIGDTKRGFCAIDVQVLTDEQMRTGSVFSYPNRTAFEGGVSTYTLTI